MMTEAEWLACEDPETMLAFLGGKTTDRKLRLFACGCWRAVLPFLGRSSREAVETSESFADGRAAREDLLAARQRARKPPRTAAHPRALQAALSAVAYVGYYAERWHRPSVRRGRFTSQLPYLRDVFGSPFGPAVLDPRWRTPVVVSLAAAAYEERVLPSGELDPARLSVLADALEETGCTGDAILGHLRGPGPHVRGCWAVDTVLGRA